MPPILAAWLGAKNRQLTQAFFGSVEESETSVAHAMVI